MDAQLLVDIVSIVVGLLFVVDLFTKKRAGNGEGKMESATPIGPMQNTCLVVMLFVVAVIVVSSVATCVGIKPPTQ